MRKLTLLVFLGISAISFAKGSGGGGMMLMRGGYGLVFPDNNNFINPGDFANSHAHSHPGRL